VLHEVAGKDQIGRALLEKPEICGIAHMSLDSGGDVIDHTGPQIDRDAPSGHDVVYEVRSARAQLHDGSRLGHIALKHIRTQRGPEDGTTGIFLEARREVTVNTVITHAYRFLVQPAISDRIKSGLAPWRYPDAGGLLFSPRPPPVWKASEC
jgi:hypothetical protein